MNKEEWNKEIFYVLSELREYLSCYVTPISKVIDKDYGEHHGSGSYLELNESKYLITNEHIGKELENRSLAHQFINSENVYRLTNEIIAEKYPIDVAVSKIDSKIWNDIHYSSLAIPIDKIATKHEPVGKELFFIIGYSGDRSKFLFNTLVTYGTPYVTQESELPENLGDSFYHFSLEYKPDRAISLDENSPGLPLPPGFSGTLVWNSRFIECKLKNEQWSPQKAIITGIVWGWPSSNACLIATKVEHLKLVDMCTYANSIA